jgi:hypothetical protein
MTAAAECLPDFGQTRHANLGMLAKSVSVPAGAVYMVPSSS